jgi:hypothetical protein
MTPTTTTLPIPTVIISAPKINAIPINSAFTSGTQGVPLTSGMTMQQIAETTVGNMGRQLQAEPSSQGVGDAFTSIQQPTTLPVATTGTPVAKPLPPLSPPAQPASGKADPLATPSTIPDEATLDKMFKLTDRWKQGAMKGAIIGAAVSPLVFLGNYYGNKQAISERFINGMIIPLINSIKEFIPTEEAKLQTQMTKAVLDSLGQQEASTKIVELVVPPLLDAGQVSTDQFKTHLPRWINTVQENLENILKNPNIEEIHKIELLRGAHHQLNEAVAPYFKNEQGKALAGFDKNTQGYLTFLLDSTGQLLNQPNTLDKQYETKKTGVEDLLKTLKSRILEQTGQEDIKPPTLMERVMSHWTKSSMASVMDEIDNSTQSLLSDKSKYEKAKEYIASNCRSVTKFFFEHSDLREKVDRDGVKAHLGDMAKSLGYALIDGLKLGTLFGTALATLQVGEVKRQLIDIRNTNRGDTPKKHWDEFLGDIDPSRRRITKPNESLAYVKDHDLSKDHAFANGFKQTLIAKGIIGTVLAVKAYAATVAACAAGLTGGILWDGFEKQTNKGESFNVATTILGGIPKALGDTASIFSKELILPFLIQPAIFTKVALAPVMGGWIAMNMVPWMNQQLGRTGQPQANPSPSPVPQPPTLAMAAAQPDQPQPPAVTSNTANPYYYSRSRSSESSEPTTWNRSSSTTPSTTSLFRSEALSPLKTVASAEPVAFTEEPTSSASSTSTLSESHPIEESHASSSSRAPHSESHSNSSPHSESHSSPHSESHSSSHSSSGGHH